MRKHTPDTTRALRVLAALLAAVIALALPAIFFSLEFRSHSASMLMEARFSASTVSDLINANLELWQFEKPRLAKMTKDLEDEGLPEMRRIVDARGRVIAQSDDDIEAPMIEQSANLLDSGTPVGRFIVMRSLRPLLLETALVGLGGLVLGGLVLLLLRVYPLRALRHALETLAHEKKHAELILN